MLCTEGFTRSSKKRSKKEVKICENDIKKGLIKYIVDLKNKEAKPGVKWEFQKLIKTERIDPNYVFDKYKIVFSMEVLSCQSTKKGRRCTRTDVQQCVTIWTNPWTDFYELLKINCTEKIRL